jgi:hypothetical protein
MRYSDVQINRAGIALFRSFMEQHEFSEYANLEFRKSISERKFNYEIIKNYVKYFIGIDSDNVDNVDNGLQELIKYKWMLDFFNFIDAIYFKVFPEINIDNNKYEYLCDFVFGLMMDCNRLAVNTSWIASSAMPIWSYAFIEHSNEYKKYFLNNLIKEYEEGKIERMKIVMNGVQLSSTLRFQCDDKFGNITNDQYYRLPKKMKIYYSLIVLPILIVVLYFLLNN